MQSCAQLCAHEPECRFFSIFVHAGDLCRLHRSCERYNPEARAFVYALDDRSPCRTEVGSCTQYNNDLAACATGFVGQQPPERCVILEGGDCGRYNDTAMPEAQRCTPSSPPSTPLEEYTLISSGFGCLGDSFLDEAAAREHADSLEQCQEHCNAHAQCNYIIFVPQEFCFVMSTCPLSSTPWDAARVYIRGIPPPRPPQLPPSPPSHPPLSPPPPSPPSPPFPPLQPGQILPAHDRCELMMANRNPDVWRNVNHPLGPSFQNYTDRGIVVGAFFPECDCSRLRVSFDFYNLYYRPAETPSDWGGIWFGENLVRVTDTEFVNEDMGIHVALELPCTAFSGSIRFSKRLYEGYDSPTVNRTMSLCPGNLWEGQIVNPPYTINGKLFRYAYASDDDAEATRAFREDDACPEEYQ